MDLKCPRWLRFAFCGLERTLFREHPERERLASGHVPIQEGHDLRPGAGLVGGEGSGTGAGGDAPLHSPEDGVVVVRPRGHVPEGIGGGAGQLLLLHPVQEGDDLCPGTGLGGREGGGGGAVGNALLHGPEDRLVVVVRGADVGEGIGRPGRFRLPQGLVGRISASNNTANRTVTYTEVVTGEDGSQLLGSPLFAIRVFTRSTWDSRGKTSGYEQLEISGDLVYGIQTFTQDEEYLRLIAQVKAWFCVMDE